ncbi:MAG: hypothetical protein KBC64_06670 [Simkaniaceae bacterium]|nr:hypothetical protein [Simkaniaceae bacterium]
MIYPTPAFTPFLPTPPPISSHFKNMVDILSHIPLDKKQPELWLFFHHASKIVPLNTLNIRPFTEKTTPKFLFFYLSSFATPFQEALLQDLSHYAPDQIVDWIQLMPYKRLWFETLGIMGIKYIFAPPIPVELQLMCYITMDHFLRKEILKHLLKTQKDPTEFFFEWMYLSSNHSSFEVDFALSLIELKLPLFAVQLKRDAIRSELLPRKRLDELLPLEDDFNNKKDRLARTIEQFKRIKSPSTRRFLVPFITEHEEWILPLFGNLPSEEWPDIFLYFTTLPNPLPQEILYHLPHILCRALRQNILNKTKMKEITYNITLAAGSRFREVTHHFLSLAHTPVVLLYKALENLPDFPRLLSLSMENREEGRIHLVKEALITHYRSGSDDPVALAKEHSFLWKKPFLNTPQERFTVMQALEKTMNSSFITYFSHSPANTLMIRSLVDTQGDQKCRAWFYHALEIIIAEKKLLRFYALCKAYQENGYSLEILLNKEPYRARAKRFKEVLRLKGFDLEALDSPRYRQERNMRV